MAHVPALYQEARLSLPSSTFLPIASNGRIQSAGRKRAFDEIAGLDEESYARKHLATEGSIFFRAKSRSPRSFVSRVLDDRKLLEVQCVDITQKHRGEDTCSSSLAFRIEFDDALREHGVAFADPEDTDALEIFALTTRNELHTITLKRDILARSSLPADFDPSKHVKRYSSSSLSFRTPYRLFAASSLELYISLNDGGFLRLDRKAGENGQQWKEALHNDAGLMGTLRGLNPLKRRQTVKHGNLELEPNSLVNVVKSPDGKHLWTVGLDHTLRAWSTSTWKQVYESDLLGESKDDDAARGKKQYTMGGEVGMVLQIIPMPMTCSKKSLSRRGRSQYYLAVNSPKTHEFKVYGVDSIFSSTEDANETIELHAFETPATLVPPVDDLLQTNIWRLEQFYLSPGSDWGRSQLWLRARTGAICKLFTVEIDLSGNADASDFETMWRDGWSVVDAGVSTPEKLRSCDDFPGDLESMPDAALTLSERWSRFLFYPDRFSTASIEAALHIYRTGRSLASSSGRLGSLERQSLAERLVATLSSNIPLQTLPNKAPDYARYDSEVRSQWQAFYSLLSHLHARRHDSINFAFDAEDGLAWSVCADFVAPARKLDELESRCENSWLLQDVTESESAQPLYEYIFPRDEQVFLGSKILAAAKSFRHGFSASTQLRLQEAAFHDAWEGDERMEPASRVRGLFERCGLDLEVADEDFDVLNDAVEIIGGLGSLQTDHFLTPLEWLDCNLQGVIEERVVPARFGTLLNITLARQTLAEARSILLDLLGLVVFMAGGLEEAELEADFRPGEIYEAISFRLKQNELLTWLATHTVHDRTLTEPEVGPTTTLFEDLFAGDWHAYKIQDAKSQESTALTKDAHASDALTLRNKMWVSGPDLSNNWNDIAASALARLLRKEKLDLAADFQRFLPDDPWCIYLRSRLYVAVGAYELSGVGFRKAAGDLAEWKGLSTAGGAYFLAPDEQHYIGHGLSSYYQHVVAIFEKAKAYSFVADFAKLALQDLNLADFTRTIADLDRKKSQKDTPAKDKASYVQREIALLKLKETHAEILLRLFNALKETGRYVQAFEALEKVQDPAPRRSGLKKLVEACVKHDDLSTLLGLPFTPEVADEADGILAQLAQAELMGSTASKHAPYYQVLYSFRVRRGNFRGASEILYDHLQRLQTSNIYAVQNPEDETMTQMYVLLINTLACCGEADAWILAASNAGTHGQGAKRRLVTLADVRREYAAELDQRSDILQGRFPLVGGDDMDVL